MEAGWARDLRLASHAGARWRRSARFPRSCLPSALHADNFVSTGAARDLQHECRRARGRAGEQERGSGGDDDCGRECEARLSCWGRRHGLRCKLATAAIKQAVSVRGLIIASAMASASTVNHCLNGNLADLLLSPPRLPQHSFARPSKSWHGQEPVLCCRECACPRGPVARRTRVTARDQDQWSRQDGVILHQR